MNVPDAAIEAAAEAFARKRNPRHDALGHSETLAIRAAIEAAMPAILTDLREGLDDLLRSDHLPTGVEEHPEGCCEICDWVGCLQDEWIAARIVRGGAA